MNCWWNFLCPTGSVPLHKANAIWRLVYGHRHMDTDMDMDVHMRETIDKIINKIISNDVTLLKGSNQTKVENPKKGSKKLI